VNPALRLRINAKAKPAAATEEAAHEKALTTGELRAILGALPPAHRLLFETLAGTGCRISEALGLDSTDLRSDGDHTTLRIERQWYRGTLKPNTKTEAGERTIDLDADLAARLWAHCADATGPMFATRSGQRLNDRNVRRALDAVTRRQRKRDGTITTPAAGPGVDWVSFHTFRHTHGSMLIDTGWTIPEVSERLGHADPAVTARVYSHKLRDRRREVPSFGGSLGNGWATQRPEIAANDPLSVMTESAEYRADR
jgi:integrase